MALPLVARAGWIAALTILAGTSAALAQTPATPAPSTTVAQETSAPLATPTPDPFAFGGYLRSYYFTRQNASNNPGVQWNPAKYNSNAVNQATWNSAVDLHGDYNFAGGGWYVGGTYLYSNPMDGPCVVAANHAKGAVCITQSPPNTNPDDTLPGFTLSTFYEAYLAYKGYGFTGKIGDQLFNSPWANPSDSRLKPAAFQGADVAYSGLGNWTFEAADMIEFENRTSSSFTDQTLLTSFPAGGGGLASNIYVPGGQGIHTSGFSYAKVGYDNAAQGYAVNGYFYGVSDLLNIWWLDAKYTLGSSSFKPFVALQGGAENNAGLSYVGKIDSQLIGVQIGANVTKNVLVAASFDSIPWRNDNVVLPNGVTCSNTNYQITAKGATLAYFLPLNAGQCFTRPNGTTSVYYGGWASPYTDNYATDPMFTTSMSQGMADRRAPGTSWKIGATFTSNNKRFIFAASDAWYNYGNAIAAENTSEWNLDGQYRFSPVKTGTYKGLLVRYRYAQRMLSNTYFPTAASYLGGLPLFKYNRAQIEYDF